MSSSFELSSVNGPKTGQTTFLLSLTLTNLFSDYDNYFGIRHNSWKSSNYQKSEKYDEGLGKIKKGVVGVAKTQKNWIF